MQAHRKVVGALVALSALVVMGGGIAYATTTSTQLAADDMITYDRSYADGTNGSALDMMEWRFDRNNDGTPDRIAYINEKGEYRGVSNGNTVMQRYRENTTVSQTANFIEITDSTGATLRFAVNRYGMVLARVYSTVASLPTSGVVAGSQAYVTGISKPVWFDGTVWRDAAGNAV
jgi:hypothetical protein